MKRMLTLFVLFLLFGPLLLDSLATQVPVLDSKQYLRTTGKTNIYSDTFRAVQGVGLLLVENGTKEDPDTMLSSAEVWVNGIRLFGPSDFNKNVHHLEAPVNLAEANTIKIVLNSKPGSYLTVKIVEDIPPPTISLSADPSAILLGAAATLTWDATLADSVTIDNSIGDVATNGSIDVKPTETTTYNVTATGLGGTVSQSTTVTVYQPPTVTISADPASISSGENSQLSWSSTNAETVTITPEVGAVSPSGSSTVTPSETTTYTITVVGPGGSASTEVTVTVTSTGPMVSITAVPETISAGSSTLLTWHSSGVENVHIDNDIGIVTLSGSYSVTPAHTTTYTISGTGLAGTVSSQVTVYVNGNPEPQPDGAFGELYNDLIPQDATIAAYDEKRFSVVTGLVHDESDLPLTDVSITIHGHPEYGTALTDIEGRFSMPVEGGGALTIVYSKHGRITSHRQIQTTWNDIAIAETIQMLPEDVKSTTLTFDGNPSTVITHTSTEIVDEFGMRSATLTFSGDNRAFLVDEQGNDVTELPSITVRATEYATQASMPAILPHNSAYTYCTELKVDGADRVRFEKPVPMWVDNFLGFDVGMVVPVGYYDRDKAVWVPWNNGVVIRLLDTNNDGIVDALDSNGDDQPDDLNSNGSINDEVSGLIDPTRYAPGSTFWRVEIEHFTPWDHNWPYGPPGDAIPPNAPSLDPKPDNPPCDGSSDTNSYVKHKTRVFHEDIPIAGTGLTLHYSSGRVKGYKHRISIPASGDTVPESLKSIIVRLEISGKIYEEHLPPKPSQSVEFVWDGLDHLGNYVKGDTVGKVSIGFVYDNVFLSAGYFTRSFAQAGSVLTGILARDEVILWEFDTITVSNYQEKNQFGNGWDLYNHHYLFKGKLLSKGDGASFSAIDNIHIITTVAGNSGWGYSGDNIQASSASLYYPADIAIDAAGNLFIADTLNHRIRKVDQKGIISTVAGNGIAGYLADDNGPAINARLNYPYGITVDTTGNIFIADLRNNRIRKVDTSGMITTVAGSGYSGFYGDNGAAINANLYKPTDVALDANGNLFIADTYNHRIRKVDANGIITTFAGSGFPGFYGDNGQAIYARLYYPTNIAIDAKGNLFIADSNNGRIRKVDTSGKITTVAGARYGSYLDNIPATSASLNYPEHVTVDATGVLFIAEYGYNRIRKVDSDGIISTVAGNSLGDYSGDNGPPKSAGLRSPAGVAIDAAGNLFIADNGNSRIRKVMPSPLAQSIGIDMNTNVNLVPDKNNLAHIFAESGRHLRTFDYLSGKTLTTFNYDHENHLASIDDRFGNTITIERDSAGNPTALISPYGHRTELTIDGEGNLTNIEFEDLTGYSFAYTSDGLMTSMTTPRNFTSTHDFDDSGRVISTKDPENGSWTLGRVARTDGTVTSSITSSEGNTTSHLDTREPGGAYRTTTTSPDGTTSVFLQTNQGLNDTVEACSMPTETIYTLDKKSKRKIPGKITTTSSAGLVNQLNIVKTYTDDTSGMTLVASTTLSQNGKTTIEKTDYQAGAATLTSPEGRVSSRTFNLNNLLVTDVGTSGLLSSHFDYDPRGRLTSITSGARSSTYEYDTRGNVASVTDSLNRVTNYTYDLLDRITQISKPDLGNIGFEYDASGNMTMLTTPVPADNLFEYNGVNKLVRYKTPLSSITEYTYDKERKLATVALPSGRTITNTYNKGLLGQTETPEWTTSYQYACGGNPSLVTRGSEQLSYGYDGTLLTSIDQTGAVNANLAFAYNKDFNVNSVTYAGKTESYAYDKDQLPISMGRFTITRNAGNGLPESVGDTAFTLNRIFNGYGEIASTEHAVNGTSALSLALTRDANGRITARSETVGGVTSEYGYSYDPVGRLLMVTRDGALVEEYRYDTNGNRTYEMNAHRGVSGRAFTHSIEDHIVTAGDLTFEFDLDDNLSRKVNGPEITDYQYSSTGELMHVLLPDGTTVDYRHDPLGRRVAKLVNDSVVEKYLWHGLTTLLAVYDGNNNLIQRFEYGDDRVPYAMTSGGATYYLAYDQVGSLRAVTDTAGNVIKRIDYDTFGTILNDTNPGFATPFGFAGGLHDRSTGLVRFGFRDYSPEIGRWTAKDPILFAGGDTNLYGYVQNNPVNFVDPLGLINWGKTLAGVGSFTDGMSMVGLAIGATSLSSITGSPVAMVGVGILMVPVAATGLFDMYHGAHITWEGLTEEESLPCHE